jgi:dipeptidyl aminopeptidase/acylaminoacyl peptidase
VTAAASFAGVVPAADGATAVALRQTFREPPTLVRLDLATGVATKLSTFNDELLAGIDLGAYESATVKGAGGDPVQAWVVYPPGFDPGRRYPLFLVIHGGPHGGVTDGFMWRWHAQVFAGWGYVVAWHNFHGSSGFGQAFTDSINPDWATKPYQDTLAVARWFAAKPWIDAERMVAGGGSYGGYLASLLLGRTHPFKTLVVHAGVYDLYAQMGADYGGNRKRFGEFWEPAQEQLYRKISPHFGAGGFQTPTLVVHGALDYRVPENHAFELFAALQTRGVRSRLVHYANENHWILKPQNSLHWYRTVQDWIGEFAPPGPR